jgi:pyruvate/2-oxoglutarate dehydrogenase complex dihydrolipoamide acyltransferase (E2) component
MATAPLAASCGRWTPARDYVSESKTDTASAYEKLLKVFGDKGYHVVEQRDGDHYAKVRAHIDEKFVSHQSFIAAQVDAAGVVHFTPSGYLVRDGKVHKKLASELLDLEYAMRGDVGPQPEPAASVSASPAPTPPPEVTTTTASAAPAPSPAPTPPPAPTPTPKPASKPKAATSSAPKATPAPRATAKPSGDDWVPVQ